MPANAITPGYRDDLAHIHDAGFGFLARNAAPLLVKELRRRDLRGGTVVDLGCGSGILSEIVADAGFDVHGVDLSPSMIEIARRRVPRGRFEVGSILGAGLPSCVGIAAVGEIVNFLFDASHSRKQELARLFKGVHEALCPGGIFVLDAAGPGRIPKGKSMLHVLADDWAVLVEAEEKGRRLTRKITSFRRTGQSWRRDDEVHRLRLYAPVEIAGLLERAGFRVRPVRRYGDYRLPPGLTAFVARKRERMSPAAGRDS